MNRIKNFIILVILIIFLYTISILPVTCFFKSVTGIYCPACGMTRAFRSILNLNFLDAIYFNILSIPLFIFIAYFSFILVIDFIKNAFPILYPENKNSGIFITIITVPIGIFNK